jgi:tripartite-type tricarboxylate transporter receptor subunit TctC
MTAKRGDDTGRQKRGAIKWGGKNVIIGLAVRRLCGGFALAVVGCLGVQSAAANDFYAGKTISVGVGVPAGGGYDLYARTLTRHMGKHIPGEPKFVVRNVPGAGGVLLTNLIARSAPRDGTEIATADPGILTQARLGLIEQLDASGLTWIGAMNREVSICVAWHTSGVTTFDQLRDRELLVGTTGVGNNLSSFEQPLVNLLGVKLRVIRGYDGANSLDAAMEREETQGRCGISWSSFKIRSAALLRDKKVAVLVQIGREKHPDLTDIPIVHDFAKSAEDKAVLDFLLTAQSMGRPYFAPPELPADRVQILRTGFNKTMGDPAMIADAEKQRMEIQLVTGEQVADLLKGLYAAPPELVERATAAIR